MKVLTKNTDVDRLNDMIMDKFSGDLYHKKSVDSIAERQVKQLFIQLNS